jgi:hypothetical protein
MIATGMDETIELQCPHCGEWLELTVTPDLAGTIVADCLYCAARLELVVTRDEWGDADVRIEKAV